MNISIKKKKKTVYLCRTVVFVCHLSVVQPSFNRILPNGNEGVLNNDTFLHVNLT